MDWAELDLPTRVGAVATIIAVLGLLVPPIGLASACVGGVVSGTAWRRSRRRGTSNRTASLCTIGCAALVVLIVVGNLVYAAAN
ncbi:MAG: hypothetical protein OEY23_05030 [Acidimicrobiia bacterium]|nr:hypothetical protein [Acidimicrobiia bacterium]